MFSFLRNPRTCLALLGGLLLLGANAVGAEEKGEDGFTPWMSNQALNAFIKSLDGDPPTTPRYWDRGNWITAVEGRWEKTGAQYRIRYAPVPECRFRWWYWYLSLSPQTFATMTIKMAERGYKLEQFHSYTNPGGNESIQAVWHKVLPLKGEPPLPAGKYKLVELDGQPPAGGALTIEITGERLKGRGPASAFSGSVRDRVSGEVKREPLGVTPDEPAAADALETRFVAALEVSDWTDDGPNLRVTQNKKVVARFAPDEGK